MARSVANVNPKRPVTGGPFLPSYAYVICIRPERVHLSELTPIPTAQALPYPLKCHAPSKAAVPYCALIPKVSLRTANRSAPTANREGDFLPRATMPDGWSSLADVVTFLKQQSNSLEEPACVVCPPVGHVLADIAGQDGCVLARMSGSGATCFGIFATPQAARQAADRLEDAHPAWWVWGGGLV